MRPSVIPFIIILLCAVVSCGSPEPHSRIEDAEAPPGTVVPLPSDPASGDRPSTADDDLLSEISDPCWRFRSGNLNLRYDRGGVLFSATTDGTIKIIDLDGADEISVDIKGSSVTVNGKTERNVYFRLLRSYGDTEWYQMMESPAGIVVIPAKKPQ